MVAFVVTVGISIYTWSSAEVSADTSQPAQTILNGTVAITNYLGTELPVSMWKCQEFPIKYVMPTTAAGPSGQASENTIISYYRDQIYDDFNKVGGQFSTYVSAASMKKDLDKCKNGDTAMCSRIEKSLLKTAMKPKCDEIRNYDIPINVSTRVYGLTSSDSNSNNSNSSQTKTVLFSTSVTNKTASTLTSGVKVYSKGTVGSDSRSVEQSCTSATNGTCSIALSLSDQTVSLNPATASYQFYSQLGTTKSQVITKKWADIKNGDQISLDLTSVAEALPAVEDPNFLKVPGKDDQTAVINVRNAKTKRILGGVAIELQNTAKAEDKLALTTTDPPTIGGKQVAGFSKATYSLVAKRNGYEIYETTININSTNKYINIDIPMKPLAGLPDPDSSAYSNTSSLLSNLNLSNLGSSTIPIISQLARLLGQGNSSSYSNYPYSTGYTSNLSQIAVVPVQLNIQPQYPFDQLSTNVKFEIQEVTTGKIALSTSFSLSPLSNSSSAGLIRYGCLNPNSQYILKLTSINNTTVSFQPYSFASGSYGQMTTLLVPLGANEVTSASDLLSSTIYRNIDRSLLTIDNFNCPSTSLSSNISGQSTWVNSTITENQLRSYAVTALNDKYYLVNTTTGSIDIHPIVFVLSQGSTGGLAFISAASGLNINSTSQSGWYVTTFTVSDNEPIIDKTKLSKVNMRPDEYARTINAVMSDTLK